VGSCRDESRDALGRYLMAANKLVERLEFCRRVGDGRWMARCPAHDDRNPSLSIRELHDGRVLVYCFAGCDTLSILAAIGLEMGDLFETPLYQRGGGVLAPKYMMPHRRGGEMVLPRGCDNTRGYHESCVEIMASAIDRGEHLSREEIEKFRASARWLDANPVPEIQARWAR
jgi:hypothetical protein